MKRKRTARRDTPVRWLPIDSRLILPLFSFGRVHGLAKVFLTLEMVLALCVVFATVCMVILRLLY